LDVTENKNSNHRHRFRVPHLDRLVLGCGHKRRWIRKNNLGYFASVCLCPSELLQRIIFQLENETPTSSNENVSFIIYKQSIQAVIPIFGGNDLLLGMFTASPRVSVLNGITTESSDRKLLSKAIEKTNEKAVSVTFSNMMDSRTVDIATGPARK
jgi:hypothetical protein